MDKDAENISKRLLQKIKELGARDKFSDDFVTNLATALHSIPIISKPLPDDVLTQILELLLKREMTIRYSNDVDTIVKKIIDEFITAQETLADDLRKQYEAIEKLEYRTPTAHEHAQVKTTLPIKARIPPNNLNEQLHLDLKKRALSFCHGAYILLRSRQISIEQQNAVMDKIFAAVEIFSQQLDKNLQYPERLKLALKKLNELITEMAALITHPSTSIEEIKKAHAELLNAEILANCERRKPCVIVTPIGLSAVQIETVEPNHFTYEQIREISNTTVLWRQSLSPVQRYWLDENKEKLANGELATPSTVLMNMPGAANVSRYEFVTADKSRYTSFGRRTLAPMNIADETTRLRLAKQNADQLHEIATAKPTQFWSGINIETITLEQSLLSPLQKWYIKFAEGFTGDNNNTKMLAAIDHALKGRSNIINSNWPVNAARIFSFGFIDKRNQNAKDKFKQHFTHILNAMGIPGKTLIDRIKQAISAGVTGLKRFVHSTEQANQLLLAFNAYLSYQEMMQNPKLRENYSHRNPEMFMACLERLMIDGTGGIISAGCKSAKDREGTVKMHTAAMILYYKKYQTLPKINDNDDKREKFAEIFTDVHHAGHQQHMANLNSYGAQGCQNGMASILQKVINAVGFLDRLKLFNVQPMLPEDIRARVDLTAKREQCQDLMARSNKIIFDADYARELMHSPRSYPARSKPVGSASHSRMTAAGISPSAQMEKPQEQPSTAYGTFYATKSHPRSHVPPQQAIGKRGAMHRPKT